LKPDGLAVIHTIGEPDFVPASDNFLDQYIFPGAVIPAMSVVMPAIENDFILEDWQNFGHDYSKTLAAWSVNADKFFKETKNSKTFLLQPYTLKPNGEVFDEVRNFFIDGQWRYSVFTHGTDGSDKGYYQEPEGPRKDACRALAEKTYQQVLKSATWQGKRQTPLLNRIDIGVIPKKGGDSLHKTDNYYFLNEIENQCTTWLDRYAPLSVQDVVAQAAIKHSLELSVGLVNAKKMPDQADIKKTLRVLNDRLGPFKHVNIPA